MVVVHLGKLRGAKPWGTGSPSALQSCSQAAHLHLTSVALMNPSGSEGTERCAFDPDLAGGGGGGDWLERREAAGAGLT